MIEELTLFWEQASAKEYDIELSMDEKKWIPVARITDGAEGEKRTIKFKPFLAKYIKIICRKRVTEWGNSLWEIEINPSALIKNKVKIPVILFPNKADTIPKNIDYIFFMSLLNSKDHRFFAGEQMRGAKFIKDSDIKPISMAYIIISTSKEPTEVDKKLESKNSVNSVCSVVKIVSILGPFLERKL